MKNGCDDLNLWKVDDNHKEIIWSHKSKDKQHNDNDKKKIKHEKTKHCLQNATQKTKAQHEPHS